MKRLRIRSKGKEWMDDIWSEKGKSGECEKEKRRKGSLITHGVRNGEYIHLEGTLRGAKLICSTETIENAKQTLKMSRSIDLQ